MIDAKKASRKNGKKQKQHPFFFFGFLRIDC
jgi:hypothetical protein